MSCFLDRAESVCLCEELSHIIGNDDDFDHKYNKMDTYINYVVSGYHQCECLVATQHTFFSDYYERGVTSKLPHRK